MVNKIATTLEQDHKLIESPQSSLSHLLNNVVWLTVLMLEYGGLGWSLWLDRSFLQVGVVMFILAVAAVRTCILTGFPVRAGLLSLTFGSRFILVGALMSSGLFDWAVAITLTWIGIFTLDLALSQSVENFLETRLSQTIVRSAA
jgi:hypothetical protein